MRKGRKIIAIASMLTLLTGMQANAAEKEVQQRSLSEYANLQVGEVYIIKEGKVTGQMPENVSYDLESNVLTLNNYNSVVQDGEQAVAYYGLGEDFTIHLEGENNITMSTWLSYVIYGVDIKLEGPGTLNLINVPSVGMGYQNSLVIDGCTINIEGDPSGKAMFYGITGNYMDECDALIKDSKINISSTKPSGSTSANAGIDAQAGDLVVQNSDITIDLVNGNIFGLAVGYKNNQDQILGGTVSVDNSVIRCNTDTDSGESYNHNMYFYNMTNKDQLYYYTSTEGSFAEKSFDEAFEKGKYYEERYDASASTVISSIPLAEYCAHEWGEGVVTTEASCENAGEKTYTCALCGETKTEEIAALGHQWSDWKVIKEANCTEDGARMRTCSRCNETETEVILKLGHNFVTKVVKQPTCTESGLQEKACTRCDLVIENETIPATGHNYEWSVEKEATFHEDGVKKGTCTNCGDVITERIPKLSESHEHDFSGKEEITKEATCTEEGSKKIYCTEEECGEYITQTIPKTAHTPSDWKLVKEATCKENGLEEKTCTVCGAVIETRVTDTIPHTYGEWKVTAEPTCTEAGVETAECMVCHESAVRGINALGHDYAEWKVTKEATCTEAGEETAACTRCEETVTRTVEATGHSFGEWKIVKEATLTEEGERQATCSVCGEVKSEIIPKLSDAQPTVPDGKVDPDKNTTDKTTSSDKNSNVPATGDETPVIPYVLSLVAAVGAIVIMGKKKISK